jgi:hypothetical protein
MRAGAGYIALAIAPGLTAFAQTIRTSAMATAANGDFGVASRLGLE